MISRLRASPRWSPPTPYACEFCNDFYLHVGPAKRVTLNAFGEPRPVEEGELREMLRIVRTEQPPPKTILTVGPDADCAAIERMTRLIEQEVSCRGDSCRYRFEDLPQHR